MNEEEHALYIQGAIGYYNCAFRTCTLQASKIYLYACMDKADTHHFSCCLNCTHYAALCLTLTQVFRSMFM